MSCEFRIQSARPPRVSGDATRCPVCHRIDWFRDGLILVEGDDGTLFADRVGPHRARQDDWSCMSCGYEIVPWSTASRLLARLAAATRWAQASAT